MLATENLYALLVGINLYESRALRPLQFATADVLAFRELLRRRMALRDADCIVLTSPPTGGAAVPRRVEVLRALDRLSKAPMGERDTFVLYFAGHGFVAGEGGYLCTTDSEPGSEQLLQSTAVSLEELRRFTQSIGAGQQILILDACRNEPTTLSRSAGSASLNEAMARDIVALARPEAGAGRGSSFASRAILSACWQGQVSYEFPQGHQGWFCYNLLQCLREHPEAEIEIGALTELVRHRMKENAWRELPEAESQEPHIIVEGRPVRLHMTPLGRTVVAPPAQAPPGPQQTVPFSAPPPQPAAPTAPFTVPPLQPPQPQQPAPVAPPDEITGRCPKCGKPYHVSLKHIGRKARCKACGESFVVADPKQARDELEELLRTVDKELDDFGGMTSVIILVSVIAVFFLLWIVWSFLWSLGITVVGGLAGFAVFGLTLEKREKRLLDRKYRDRIRRLAVQADLSNTELTKLINDKYDELSDVW